MDKVIKIFGIVLLLASFVLLIAFFATLGQGSASIESAAGEAIHVPLLTDLLLNWAYVLFGLAIVSAVGISLVKFVKSLITTPAKAIKALIPIILFAAIFVIAYFSGSGEYMSIIGYDGTQNEGLWAQISDMFIYTIYTMFVVLLLAIFGSRIYTALK